MHVSYILIVLVAAVAYAKPVARSDNPDGVRHSVDLYVVTSAADEPTAQTSYSVELNTLTPIYDEQAYQIKFEDLSSDQNINGTKVECRAFKDESGIVPGSAPFNDKIFAYLSTTGVKVSSVLCYRVTDAEAKAF